MPTGSRMSRPPAPLSTPQVLSRSSRSGTKKSSYLNTASAARLIPTPAHRAARRGAPSARMRLARTKFASVRIASTSAYHHDHVR